MDLLGFKGGDQYLLGEKKEQLRKFGKFLKNITDQTDIMDWEGEGMIPIDTPSARVVQTRPRPSALVATNRPQLPTNYQSQNTTATAPNRGRDRVGFISSLFGN